MGDKFWYIFRIFGFFCGKSFFVRATEVSRCRLLVRVVWFSSAGVEQNWEISSGIIFGAVIYWYRHVDNLVSTSRSRVNHG